MVSELELIRTWIEEQRQHMAFVADERGNDSFVFEGHARALAALEEAIDHCDRGMLGMFQRQMHESILALLRSEQQEPDDGKV